MAPQQFSFLHPERILFALQFFYKQYRSLPLNVSLPQSYSLMYIYLFFSPLPAITLSPYWLTKVISRAVEMEGGGGKWDSNHYKSQGAKNSHQTEAFTPKTNTGSSVRNFCYLFFTEWTWKLQHWAAAQVLYSWFVCDTIPCCINTAAVTVETFSFPCWLTSRQLIPVLNSQLWTIISFQLESSLHPAYPPLSSPHIFTSFQLSPMIPLPHMQPRLVLPPCLQPLFLHHFCVNTLPCFCLGFCALPLQSASHSSPMPPGPSWEHWADWRVPVPTPQQP